MTWARRGQFGSRRFPARAAAVAALGAAALAGATGCGRSGKHPLDAALDVAATGDAPASDGNPKPVALDFSATGCSSYDSFNARCDGNAPLTVVFTPIASPELTRFLWDFGDGSVPSSDRSPSHTYALPILPAADVSGYDVTLVAAGSARGRAARTPTPRPARAPPPASISRTHPSAAATGARPNRARRTRARRTRAP